MPNPTELPKLTELEAVKYEVIDGNIALVTLTRPETLNALNTKMHYDADACWEEINNNPNIRAGVITGTGRFFCSGRDIKEYMATYGSSAPGEAPPELRALDDPSTPIYANGCNHYVFTKPMVAAMNGPAVGGGLEMVLTCAMVVMADDAYIADLHAKINAGGMNCLRYILPPMIANEVTMTDRRLTAEECLRYGLANYVLPKEQVLDKALDLARATTRMGPDAIRRLQEGSVAYQIMTGNVASNETREQRRRTGREEMLKQRSHADTDLIEGMAAFVQKRSAEYVKPS
jgi:enoyl-CoA hydratase/carnithine racemase